MFDVFQYVGPAHHLTSVVRADHGHPVTSLPDLTRALDLVQGGWATYTVSLDGVLHLAPRRQEHVGCAGGRPVLAAGEMQFEGQELIYVSNQSTGYCPHPECWPAVAAALDRAGIDYTQRDFDGRFEFRRCVRCGERAILKPEWEDCPSCGTALPEDWKFADEASRIHD